MGTTSRQRVAKTQKRDGRSRCIRSRRHQQNPADKKPSSSSNNQNRALSLHTVLECLRMHTTVILQRPVVYCRRKVSGRGFGMFIGNLGSTEYPTAVVRLLQAQYSRPSCRFLLPGRWTASRAQPPPAETTTESHGVPKLRLHRGGWESRLQPAGCAHERRSGSISARVESRTSDGLKVGLQT